MTILFTIFRFIVVSSKTDGASTNYYFPINSHVKVKYPRANLAFVGPSKAIHQTVPLRAERSYSSDLDTSYEWLSRERATNAPERHDEIRWFHQDDAREEDGDRDTDTIRMPLYPLGAVHVPHAGENYTIVNIEQKNVKMAMVSSHLAFIQCIFLC